MAYNQLQRTALDSGNMGLDLIEILSHLHYKSDLAITKQIQAGEISINYQKVRDIKYVLEPGTYLIAQYGVPFAEVTIL